MLKKVCMLVIIIFFFTFSGCTQQNDVDANKNAPMPI